MHRSIATAAILLPLTACTAGTVEVVGIDDFGPLRSAEWLRVETLDEDVELLVLSSEPHVCRDLTAAVEAFNDAFAGWIEDIEEEDDWERFCEDAPDIYAQAADLSDAFMGPDTKIAYLGLFDEHDGEPLGIDDGDYETDGEGEDGGVWGFVNYYSENPYRVLAEDWVDRYPRFCGVDDEDLYAESMEWWSLVDGDVQIEDEREDRVRVVLDAELHDDEGDNDGDIHAEFDAALCEISVPNEAYHLSFF